MPALLGKHDRQCARHIVSMVTWNLSSSCFCCSSMCVISSPTDLVSASACSCSRSLGSGACPDFC